MDCASGHATVAKCCGTTSLSSSYQGVLRKSRPWLCLATRTCTWSMASGSSQQQQLEMDSDSGVAARATLANCCIAGMLPTCRSDLLWYVGLHVGTWTEEATVSRLHWTAMHFCGGCCHCGTCPAGYDECGTPFSTAKHRIQPALWLWTHCDFKF